jgi:serine/threonine protein kinase
VHCGDVIDGRFENLDLAGAGGMGTVYRAVDRSNGTPVALKVLRNPIESVLRIARNGGQ